MASLQMSIQIDPRALKAFERRVKVAMIMSLEAMVDDYLASQMVGDGDKSRELKGFVDWAKSRVDEPDAPGPAVY